ncbi:hypothetical protein [Levilactobacillus andaensis]|uniref:hypothetical protein n=1 Tax=Levilactobacillus andaensis TaxID=2799570 RepID=UPI0019416D0C|nr:hypothetical protein [Levilactobacillus andaensis]
MKSEIFLKEQLSNYFTDGLYLAPHIPSKKLVNAHKNIANDVDSTYILGLVDTTIFGSGKEGMVFTGENFYLHEGALGIDQTLKIPFDKILSATHELTKTVDDNENEHEHSILTITLAEQEKPIVIESNTLPLEQIAQLLTDIQEQVDETESTNQLLSLKQLDPDAILAYFKLFINYLKRDSKIDRKEYANLAGLISTTITEKELTDNLRSYRLDQDTTMPTDYLINQLKETVPLGSQETIFGSLIDDLLIVTPNKNEYQDIPEFMNIMNQLNITNDQVKFFIRNQEVHKYIIDHRINDKEARKVLDNVAALGVGIGVSFAALGVTGFTIGALGETGLGMLAVATMSTGGMALAAAGVSAAGIASYAGIKHLSSGTHEDNLVLQELLQTNIKRQSAAISFLLDDINYISHDINELLKTQDVINTQNEKIKSQVATLMRKLAPRVQQLQSATNATATAKSDQQEDQRNLIISELPHTLNVQKLEELLNQTPNSTRYGEALEQAYHFQNDGDNTLNEQLSVPELEVINAVLKKINYYKITTMANAKDLGKKGKDAAVSGAKDLGKKGKDAAVSGAKSLGKKGLGFLSDLTNK